MIFSIIAAKFLAANKPDDLWEKRDLANLKVDAQRNICFEGFRSWNRFGVTAAKNNFFIVLSLVLKGAWKRLVNWNVKHVTIFECFCVIVGVGSTRSSITVKSSNWRIEKAEIQTCTVYINFSARRKSPEYWLNGHLAVACRSFHCQYERKCCLAELHAQTHTYPSQVFRFCSVRPFHILESHTQYVRFYDSRFGFYNHSEALRKFC